MSKSEKKYFSIFLTCVCVFLFVSPYFILPRVYAGRDNWKDTAPPNATILELWEIDTFEGGSSSRAKFLERSAYAFQKETFSAYVLVRSLSLNQAKAMLASGTKPDMVSFGIGAGEFLQPFCLPLETDYFVRSDLIQSGLIESNLLAIPWCVGGYCLCADSDFDFANLTQESIGCGMAFNVPMKSLDQNLKLASKKNYTQFEAYENFLRGEFDVLLGTQRDFYRLNKKVENGVIGPISFKYLQDYTDLAQMICVCNKENAKVSEKFIEFLLTPQTQTKLNDIGLFSVLDISIYSDEYADFEKAMRFTKKTLNVFTPNVNILAMQGREIDEKSL